MDDSTGVCACVCVVCVVCQTLLQNLEFTVFARENAVAGYSYHAGLKQIHLHSRYVLLLSNCCVAPGSSSVAILNTHDAFKSVYAYSIYI